MDPERALILEFHPQIEAELARIGFSHGSPPTGMPEAVPAIGLDRPFSRDGLAAYIEELRSVPSNVGWRGLFLHFGVDPDTLRNSDMPPTT